MDYEVEVKFQNKILKGILINEDKEFIVLKLSSGYNANLKKKEVEILSKNKIEKKEVSKKEKLDSKKVLPKVTILHTGGTIASKVDYVTGAVSSKFTVDELLGIFPELNSVAQIDAKMIGNLFSEDMRFAHYNLILKEIKLAIENKSEGVIISHGTDTLHYSSAALQYSLKNLSIPVILVGAQRSSDRPSSDAYTNLNAAVDFILENSKLDLKYQRVGVCMHEKISDDSYLILDGINVKKMHSTRRDAFKQINYLPVARIKSKKIEIIRKDLFVLKTKENFSYVEYNTNLKIGFFKAHPNLFPEEIEALSIYDAVIIEGTGLGHLAVNEVDKETLIHKKNLESLKNLCKKINVIVGVQTVYGETNLNVYSSGRYIKESGVLGNHMNLTTESLFLRAAYCLSQKDKSFKDSWNENLEGFDVRSLEIDDE
ncbi:MAG: Glu-tRNA(Gln) amidotransferase subunit GatD [Candidatus Woesearchaeota archaeon]|jgi:glutamyl-tRNA(Gln) amidotransferase subunit D|nr:Glu-tRNA(Gln) amidotransferase subunit GatD [Candidatus Woesearchaeota archaeon]